jgi:lon-related putative ATP-dependent protease
MLRREGIIMIKELAPEQCRSICPEITFKCKSSEELSPLMEIIGQDRAVHALQFGLRIRDQGFNVFVAGLPGTGRKTAIVSFIEQLAMERGVPDDWCYVNNFKDPTSPRALRLPAGKGGDLKKEMEKLVSRLATALREAFESTEYSQQRTTALHSLDEKRKEFVATMSRLTSKAGFQITQSPIGLLLVPVIGGKPVSDEELANMPLKDRKKIEDKREMLQAEVQKSLIQLRDLDREAEEKVTKLNRDIATYVIEPRLLSLREKFGAFEEVLEYLVEVQTDILDNIPAILTGDQKQAGPMGIPITVDGPAHNYVVNLIVDNSKAKGAPVVIETNPSYFRLFGATEKEARFGALFTDYTMVRAGAMHKANGGFLVVPVEGLFSDALAWPSLKQTLSTGKLEIEDPAVKFGYIMTKSLRPEAIPFDAKVILLGDPYSYEVLYSADREFKELFKVKGAFDTSMDRNRENINQYAQFVCTLCQKEKLKHLDPGALSAVVEHGSRLTEDKAKLSTLFSEIADLIREANFYAKTDKAKLIKRQHINKALEEKVYRSNIVQKKIQEAIGKGIIIIDVVGEKAGQVNGLSVMSTGDYAFGMPSRITASVGVGKDGIINIEREAQMSGPSHTKGVMILSGYLNGMFAKERPLSLTAKLVFEQNYSGVDGDSASSTELYAILSALSEKPIRQYIAVTGSVNQKGEVQAIGGINEKIEGYFEVCKLLGLNGKNGVMMPQSNVQHLMLKDEVVAAVKSGQFHIYPVQSIAQGIEVLTGVKAGEPKPDGSFGKGTINYLVQARLSEMAERVKEYRS